MFGIEAADRMVWFKVNEAHHPALKTFLVFLHFIKENDKVEIPMDTNIVERLRNI